MKKILVIDNYDSFAYNLVHAIYQITQCNNNIDIFRNDQISLDKINAYHKIILSPGPGIPDEANILKPLIKKYYSTKSILGVCLGQQAINEVFGGSLINTKEVYHGVSSLIKIIDNQEIIFKGLPETIQVGRYHSWIVNPKNLPVNLKITSLGPQGEIMSLRHKEYDICGVQFHPESILTPNGQTIIQNWLNI